MSQALIDPEEVRRFAAELKRFNGDLRERSASLMARLTALGDTWQDRQPIQRLSHAALLHALGCRWRLAFRSMAR